MTDSVLKVEDLRVQFDDYEGTHRVLDGVDITVGENETVALVGESGCGKSVTAKTIMGTLPTPPGEIVDGSIYYRGTDLLQDDATKRLNRQEMSMIFQNPMTYLSPVYTVGSMMADVVTYSDRDSVSWWEIFRNILGQRRADGELRERCIELFEQLQISDPEGILDMYPVELSGGMRQRVIIALALINDPQFLIADEPTTALDVTVQDQILTLLKERIQARNLSMLYITHNLGVAREIADRVYIMYAGEIAEVADTDELFEAPLHPYSQGLLDSIPKLTGFESTGIEGQIPNYTDPPDGCRFHPRCPFSLSGTCDTGDLSAREIGDNRTVACHLYDDGMAVEEAVAVTASETEDEATDPQHDTDESAGDDGFVSEVSNDD